VEIMLTALVSARMDRRNAISSSAIVVSAHIPLPSVGPPTFVSAKPRLDREGKRFRLEATHALGVAGP
jgi:hypothetical protein